MKKKRVCDCGSAADWEQVGSTWVCVACREKDVKKNKNELQKALEKMERSERALYMLRVDTGSITELLKMLSAEVDKIEV